ncbi:hypothetical protein O7983_000467 [Mycoplasmopsis felis]
MKEYVDLYNKERIQSNLEWKTPQQRAMMLEFTKNVNFLYPCLLFFFFFFFIYNKEKKEK